MRFPSAPSPKTWYVRALLFGPAALGASEDARLISAGRRVLGGPKHLPSGAESSEAGRQVRRRLLQQGTHQRLCVDAEEPPLHLRPRGAGERPEKSLRWGPALELNNLAPELTCGCLIPQEAAMQLFQCHYREGELMSGLYFDYIKDVLHAAASREASGLSCKPPPCLNLHPPPGASHFFKFLMGVWKAKAAQKPVREY